MVWVAYHTHIFSLDDQWPTFPYRVRKKRINNHASSAQTTATVWGGRGPPPDSTD